LTEVCSDSIFLLDGLPAHAHKEDTEHMTKKLIEEYQRWGLNVNTLKTEYLNIGSDIQNMKLEDNIKIKGSMAFKYLGSIFTNSGKCKKVLNRIQQARKVYFGVNIFN